METDYNFWRDLLDTYQSLTPWVQMLWLIAPLGFALALIKIPKSTPRRQTSPLSPPSPPPAAMPHYRGTIDAQGVLYLEPVADLEQREPLEERSDLRLR